MRLSAAVLPPESACQELADLVRSVGPGTPELEPVYSAAMNIPITNFGNVALRDSVMLRQTIQRVASTWRSPKLRFSGGTALEWPGDDCVWAKLDGDVDGLREIARGVPTAVRPLGFLVDRRTFRPWLSVGSITDHTTAPYLQRLVDALDDFQGELWTLAELSLLQRRPADDDEEPDITEVIERYPLAVG